MNIGFDIDDTLTNGKLFAQKFYEELERISDKNKKQNLLKNTFKKVKKLAGEVMHNFKQQFLKNVPISEDAKLVLEELKEQGHRIFIITKRFSNKPYERSIKLLTKNKLPYDKLIINAGNKLQACKDNNIDLFIDNSTSICDNLNKNGIKAYVINTYYNKQKETISPRVNTLEEFLQIILNYKAEAEL
jgi:uncharacterized HAD superfamily protein